MTDLFLKTVGSFTIVTFAWAAWYFLFDFLTEGDMDIWVFLCIGYAVAYAVAIWKVHQNSSGGG